MRRLAAFLWVPALLVLAACSASDAEVPTPLSNAQTTEEVAAFLEVYLAALDAQDAEAVGRSVVGEGRFAWLEDGQVRYRSSEEIVAGLSAFPPGTVMQTELSDLAVMPVGATGAHAWATFTTTVGTGPRRYSFGGAISFVLEREDGSWRLAGGHTSSPTGR